MSQTFNIPVRQIKSDSDKGEIAFANLFAFTQVDMDVVLDVCFVDPKQIIEINQRFASGTNRPEDVLDAHVVHRIGMSISSLIKLKQQLDQLFANMERQGQIIKKEAGPTPANFQ